MTTRLTHIEIVTQTTLYSLRIRLRATQQTSGSEDGMQVTSRPPTEKLEYLANQSEPEAICRKGRKDY